VAAAYEDGGGGLGVLLGADLLFFFCGAEGGTLDT